MHEILAADGAQFACSKQTCQGNFSHGVLNRKCIVMRLGKQACPAAIAGEQQSGSGWMFDPRQQLSKFRVGSRADFSP